MSQVPFYPTAQQHGGYQYTVQAQSGMPAQQPYQPQQYIVMSNVQPGPPGPQSSYPGIQQYQVPGAYIQLPPRGMPDQASGAMQYGQGMTLTQNFQTSSASGQRSGFQPVQQILMPAPHQPYMNAQPVQMPAYSSGGHWQNNTQYSNGPQQQPPQTSNSFAQPAQGVFKKQSDPRQQLYHQYGNPTIAQPMSQQQTLPQQTPIQQPQAGNKTKPRKSAIQIVDPSTGLAVNMEDLSKSAVQNAPAGDNSLLSSSPANNKVAADFAAAVAATLHSPPEPTAETSAPPMPITVAEDCIADHSAAAEEVDLSSQQHGSNQHELTEHTNSVSMNTKEEKSVSHTLSASTPAFEFRPSATLLTVAPPLAVIEVDTIETSQLQHQDDVVTESDITIVPVSLELSQAPSSDAVSLEPKIEEPLTMPALPVKEASHSTSVPVLPTGGSTGSQSAAVSSDAPSQEDPARKDIKKKKNKRKDVNNKGQNLYQGTDMDAYIDEVTPVNQAVVEEPKVASVSEETEVVVAKSEETEEQVATVTELPDVVVEAVITASETAAVTSAVIDARTVEVSKPSEPVESSAEVQAVESVSVDIEPERVPVAEEAMQVDSVPTLEAEASVVTEEPLTDSVNNADSKPDEGSKTDDVAAVASTGEDSKSEAAKPELKYKYAEEQWSPVNPEGKKHYDRAFMMQLQYTNLSKQKPNLPNLPDIVLSELPGPNSEIIRNRSIELGRMGMSMAVDFTPGYVKSSPSGSKGGRPVMRNSMKKDMGNMGPSMPSGGRKVISLTLQQDIQLNKADNAWKPTLVNQKDISDYDAATEELYKKVRGILNKLTPQKFVTLMQQVRDLQIDTEERLKGCINIIFEKAISEPNFSVAYANMAKQMLSLNVQRQQDPTQTVTFRTLLLNKCQQEFEKDKLEELDMAERQKKIEEADSDEKRKQLTEEQNQAATKSKRRSLGNIRFIGELYKLKMLTETIMHECLMKLLRANDEESLECLCQLLTTIGQELDNKQSKLQPRMDLYFKQLDTLVSDRSKVSSRIRFMLLDTIDLRKVNWVPRRANNNPKTIEQIHREAQEEEQKKKVDMQNAVIERGRRGGGNVGGGGGPGAGRGGPPQGANAGEDGWNTVTRPPKSQIVDPNRLKLTKREQVDENIQLGPGGRGMTTWQFGSRGGGKAAAAPNPENDNRQQINRYSLLNNQEFNQPADPRSRGGRGGVTPSGTGFRPNRDYQGSMSGPAGRPVGPRQSLERNIERQDRHELSSPASSRSASRESRPANAAVKQSERPAPPMGAVLGAPVKTTERELTPDEIIKKTKSIVEEYLHLNDLKEATECVKELGSSKSLHLLVYHSLMLNLERSQQARQRTGILLQHLIKARILSNSQYVEGTRMVLEMADDMVMDIPHLWQYIGEMLSPMVEDGGGLPLSSLRNVCQPLLDCSGGDKAGVVMSLVLHDAVQRLGEQRIAELWQLSGLDWSEFLPADIVDNFLKENGLEFTLVKSDPLPQKPITAERLQEELNRLYGDSDVTDELVLDYLKKNVGEEIDAKCIRALSTAIASTALMIQSSSESDDKKILFNIPLIKKRVAVLSKVINGRQDLEIEVLFAIQVIVHRKDVYTGAISEVFDILYDEDVVSDTTFFRWRDDRMFGEQIGRGVAISTLNQFFKWLEEDTTTTTS